MAPRIPESATAQHDDRCSQGTQRKWMAAQIAQPSEATIGYGNRFSQSGNMCGNCGTLLVAQSNQRCATLHQFIKAIAQEFNPA
jgi:hypothetical protein